MKIIYYIKNILFVLYLVTMFLLMDNIYKSNFLDIIYFTLNLFYSFIIILTILSKKKIFKETISYDILNIGIYLYTFMLYKITISNSLLDIINNQTYFQNNYILVSILLLGLIIYTLILNKYNKKIYFSFNIIFYK